MAHITRYGFLSLCFGPVLDSLFLCVKYFDQICGPAINWGKGGTEAGREAGRLLTSPGPFTGQAALSVRTGQSSYTGRVEENTLSETENNLKFSSIKQN